MITTANPETFITGETVADTGYYSDAEGAPATLAITDTVSEMGATGMYQIELDAGEMDHDLIIIKFTSTSAADTAVLIRTRGVDIDDLNVGKTGYSLTTANWNVGKTGYELIADSSAVTIGTVNTVGGLAAGIIDNTSVGTLDNTNFAFVDSSERVDVGQWLGTAATSGTGGPDVNVNAIGDSTTAATNAVIVYATDFNTNYNQTDDAWVTNGTSFIGTGWNVNKTGYSLTTANWNVGKTGYELIADSSAVTIGTVNTLTNLPSIPANWITLTGITDGAFTAAKFAATSLNGKGDWNIDKTGYSLTTANWNVGKTGYELIADSSAVTVGAVTGLTASNLDATVSSRATSAKQDTMETTQDNMNLGIIYGVAETGTLSQTVCTSDQAGNFADDELIGRVIVFTGGTANGQAAVITDYANTAGTITFSGGITTPPLNNDTFKIV